MRLNTQSLETILELLLNQGMLLERSHLQEFDGKPAFVAWGSGKWGVIIHPVYK